MYVALIDSNCLGSALISIYLGGEMRTEMRVFPMNTVVGTTVAIIIK